ncbi:uncharacterized protein LOC120080255 [Benincasa hispida]|uniref:uncharacterized protein LOC120080255 n=1 Tax=Benincasa hispida TaxID=102211 RepID=UPI001901BBDA|nr:uncharacterized protein LOC120080255 [Benincasa hispida]
MSSSILSSQSMAMAFAALSGTVIVILSFCLHKSDPSISSVVKKKEMEKKKKGRKRVHFADDLAIFGTEELQIKKGLILGSSPPPGRGPARRLTSTGGGGGGMPANRVALYNGILRDRLVHRIAYSL